MANIIFQIPIITCLSFFSLVSKAYQTDSSYHTTDSDSTGWASTYATWYGDSTGAGSDGGACGYGNGVESPILHSLITAVAPSLFNNGQGCGLCYKVKCTSSSSKYCSGNPVTVVATDSCLGCDHLFDLSGASFGAMAIVGEEGNLRNVGILEIQYQSVGCNFDVGVTFVVKEGSNSNYFAVAVEFENGFGISGAELGVAAAGEYNWVAMSDSWGGVYCVSLASSPSMGPFSIKLTTSHGSKTIVADGVIPENYEIGGSYNSNVNF